MFDVTKKRMMRAVVALAAMSAAAIAIGCSGEATADGNTPEAEEAREQEQALFRAGCTSTVCIRAGRAGCWSATPTTSACRSCENAYGQTNAMAIWGGCSKESAAYSTCLKTSEFTCVDAGVAAPAGCDDQRAALEKCLKGDAGRP